MTLLWMLACGGGAAKELAHTEQVEAEVEVSWDGTRQAAEALAERAVTEKLGRAPGRVKAIARKQAPEGVFVVKALEAEPRHDDDSATFGVVTEAGVELDLDKARAIVVAAWSYGEERTVDAATFAAVIGPLTGENGSVVTSEEELEGLRDVLREGLSAPEEVEREGRPGVAFDTRGSEGSWRTVAWVAADGSVPFEITPHGF